MTAIIEETVRDIFGEASLEMMRPIMGGEDFSAYQQATPGTFVFVGAGNEEKGIAYPHHHSRFTVNEDALENGVKMFVNMTFRLLEAKIGGEK